MRKSKIRLGCTIAALFLSWTVGNSPAVAQNNNNHSQGNGIVHHVLLISVDGLHRQDLSWCVSHCPNSALARLSLSGVTYANATTTTPSDSFPGLLALVTGGTPKSTGVYYDDSYDRTLYAPGNFTCQNGIGGGPGTEVVLDEFVDRDTTQLFSGGIDPDNLPRTLNGQGKCVPVYPHDFIKVNTIFEVAKAVGLQTAWSDKHPSYDIVNGPSGEGVDDLYTPEINSQVSKGGTVNGVNLTASAQLCTAANSLLNYGGVSQYTDCVPTQEAYDDVKVQAIINQIDGRESGGSGTGNRVPAIFGMNFQAVSVGQKLRPAGYTVPGTPSAALAHAIEHTDASIGRMVAELQNQNLVNDTLIIITAKHGQSPIDFTKLQMEPKATQAPDHTVTDPSEEFSDSSNAEVKGVDQTTFTNPHNLNCGVPASCSYSTSGHLQTDDVGIVWLQNDTDANVAEAALRLTTDAADIHATVLPAGTIFASNITSGAALAAIFGDPDSLDPVAAARAPDVFIQPDYGVIYSGSKKKIAEHGGGSADDIDVALLVSFSFLGQKTVNAAVSTTQVAPTILKALGLNPNDLQAVVKENTQVLPGIF